MRDGFTAKLKVVSFAHIANSLLKKRTANRSAGAFFLQIFFCSIGGRERQGQQPNPAQVSFVESPADPST